MAHSSNNSYPSDISVLLRAYGEQRWLTAQVLPVLAHVERPATIPPEQLAAAYAYLEVLWLEAGTRAAETDSALMDMLGGERAGEGVKLTERERLLRWKALRYHATVRSLRGDIDARVRRALAVPDGSSRQQHATL